MSSTIRWGESIASAFAISSRLIDLKPARFSGSASSSVSNDCNREVSAAPRSQVFSEPISRKVGSCESRSASFTSSYPANRLYTDWRNGSASGSCAFFPRRGIVNLGSELKHWSHEEGPVSLLRSSFSSRNHQLCRLGLPSFLPELPRCRGSSRGTGNHRLL